MKITDILKRLLCIKAAFMIALVSMAPVSQTARAQGIPVYDNANFIENVVAGVNMIRQIINQIVMIKQNITKIQLQIRALRRLGRPNWRNLGSYLSSIEAVMMRGQALVATSGNIDELFRASFPGFNLPPLLPEHTQARIQSGLETARSAVHAARAHYAQLRMAQEEMNAIKRSVSTIAGHQEALESLIMTSAYQAEETMLLRHVLLSQQVLQAIELARQYDEEAAQEVIRTRLSAGIGPLARSRCRAIYDMNALIRPGGRTALCPPLPPADAMPLYPEYALYSVPALPDYPGPDWGAWNVPTYPFAPIDYGAEYVEPEERPPGGGVEDPDPIDELPRIGG